jgi:5'-nucleotidase
MPRILITNDDGINAEGLKILENIALEISDDVWVVAPETEQSGAAHSLTLHLPVRVRKISPKRFAVSGTPTDCVLLALKEIVPVKKKPVTLLLSGVNHGSNVGDDVTYSGTIAAAMEGTILNIPSIAMSLLCNGSGETQWQSAEKHAPEIIKKLIAVGWRENTLINMNFPDCAASKVQGVKVCPQGKRIVNIKLSERNDPRGRPYFWLGGDRDNTPEKSGVDIDYLHNDYITITPINMDLTDYQSMAKISSAF